MATVDVTKESVQSEFDTGLIISFIPLGATNFRLSYILICLGHPLFTHLTVSSYFICSYTTGKWTLTKVSMFASDVAWQVFSSYVHFNDFFECRGLGVTRIGSGR